MFLRSILVKDLFLGFVRNPRIGLQTARLVIARKARIRQSVRLAERNRSSLRDDISLSTMTRDALIMGLSQKMGVIELDRLPGVPSIGVAEVNLLSALHWLEPRMQDVRMHIGREQVTLDDPNSKNRVLSAKSIRLTWRGPSKDLETISIEPYFKKEPEKWISTNSNNRLLRAIYDDRLEVAGLSRATEILGAPSFAAQVTQEPIDVVYTWVNHADPEWDRIFREHKELHRKNTGSAGMDARRTTGNDALSLTRFHSNDELRYSMRSIAECLPWVRNIIVFSNCAPPSWLNLNDTRIRWVTHSDVIPSVYLPTFSSHVIESFLHHIPGLSDLFIYMNDDVFIGKPLPLSFFFARNGASRAFLETYGMVSGEIESKDPDYLNASRNSARLIRECFGYSPTQLHQHTAFALRRDTLKEIEDRWPEQIESFRKNRFRTPQDLNITSFLHHHYGLGTGKAVEASVRNAFIKSSDVNWRSNLKSLRWKDFEVLCINEGGNSNPDADWHASVKGFLETTWPLSAPWEQ